MRSALGRGGRAHTGIETSVARPGGWPRDGDDARRARSIGGAAPVRGGRRGWPRRSGTGPGEAFYPRSWRFAAGALAHLPRAPRRPAGPASSRRKERLHLRRPLVYGSAGSASLLVGCVRPARRVEEQPSREHGPEPERRTLPSPAPAPRQRVAVGRDQHITREPRAGPRRRGRVRVGTGVGRAARPPVLTITSTRARLSSAPAIPYKYVLRIPPRSPAWSPTVLADGGTSACSTAHTTLFSVDPSSTAAFVDLQETPRRARRGRCPSRFPFSFHQFREEHQGRADGHDRSVSTLSTSSRSPGVGAVFARVRDGVSAPTFRQHAEVLAGASPLPGAAPLLRLPVSDRLPRARLVGAGFPPRRASRCAAASTWSRGSARPSGSGLLCGRRRAPRWFGGLASRIFGVRATICGRTADAGEGRLDASGSAPRSFLHGTDFDDARVCEELARRRGPADDPLRRRRAVDPRRRTETLEILEQEPASRS